MGQAPSPLSRGSRSSTKAALAEARAALMALAAGDYGRRLNVSAGDPELAAAFNRVASTLATLDPAGSPLADPRRFETLLAPIKAEGAQTSYVAILEVEAFVEALAEVDLRSQANVLAIFSERTQRWLPSAVLGRVSRSTLEFRFAAQDVEAAAAGLTELVRAAEAPLSLPEGDSCFKVAIGFAEWTPTNASLFRVMANAEHALAKARESHTKVATFTERDRADADDRKALIHDLSRALANDELSMVYQPKLNLRAKKIQAAEALIRWRHPVRGWVSPNDFIWLAERSGEIDRITRFTIERTIAEQAELAARGERIAINVNISGQLISNEAFVDWAVATVQAAPGAIGFEITETAVISDPDRALAHMRRIAEAGIEISIDDYGSGLSSLVYLKQFPAKELKIDRAFISELTRSHRDPLIVRSTIDLAHALDMEVTAEGVENAMTLALLQVMGCDQVQGYHIAKPMSAEALVDFLADYRASSSTNSVDLNIRAALTR